MRILFFGSDKFSVVILSELYKNLSRTPSPSVLPIKHLEVVTPSGRPHTGTHHPVLDYSHKHNIKCHFWEQTETRKMILLQRKFDIGVVAAFGYFIPSKIIDSFPKGMINLHGSLIPRLRGAAPIENAILNGDSTTGLTVMEVSKGRFDHGRVLSQESIDIPRDMTSNELRLHMAEVGRKLLVDTLINLEELQRHPISLDESSSSTAPRINNTRGRIEFGKCRCEELHNMHRALLDRGGVWCRFGMKRVRLYNVISPLEESVAADVSVRCAGATPGQMHYAEKYKLIGLKMIDGWAGFENLHIEYRKKISAFEFQRNYLIHPTSLRNLS